MLQFVPMCLLSHYWKKAWFCLFYLPPPIQVFIHIDHIFPKPSLLLPKQSPVSQPLKHQMLQSLYHLHGLPLSLFQCVHGSLILWSSVHDPAVQVCLTRAEQRGSHPSISSALPNAPQPSLLQGCTAGLCSDCWIPGSPGPSLQSCFLAASPDLLLQILFWSVCRISHFFAEIHEILVSLFSLHLIKFVLIYDLLGN